MILLIWMFVAGFLSEWSFISPSSVLLVPSVCLKYGNSGYRFSGIVFNYLSYPIFAQ